MCFPVPCGYHAVSGRFKDICFKGISKIGVAEKLTFSFRQLILFLLSVKILSYSTAFFTSIVSFVALHLLIHWK